MLITGFGMGGNVPWSGVLHVDPAGRNGAYTTITAAMAVAVRNNLVVVHPGTYTESNIQKEIAVANTTVSRTSNIITVTATAHGFAVGDRAAINGADESFCGEFLVATVADSSHFTVASDGSNGSAGTPGYSAGVVSVYFEPGAVSKSVSDSTFGLVTGGSWIEILGYGDFLSANSVLVPFQESQRVNIQARRLFGYGSGAVVDMQSSGGTVTLNLDALVEITATLYDCLILTSLRTGYIRTPLLRTINAGNPIETAANATLGNTVVDVGQIIAGGAASAAADAAINLSHDAGNLRIIAGQIKSAMGVLYVTAMAGGDTVIQVGRGEATAAPCVAYTAGGAGRIAFENSRLICSYNNAAGHAVSLPTYAGTALILTDTFLKTTHASANSLYAAGAVTVYGQNLLSNAAKHANVTVQGTQTVDANAS